MATEANMVKNEGCTCLSALPLARRHWSPGDHGPFTIIVSVASVKPVADVLVLLDDDFRIFYRNGCALELLERMVGTSHK